MSGSRTSYNAHFKLMVINHAEDKNNYAEGGQFGVTEGNICKWQQMKEKCDLVTKSIHRT